MGGDWEELALGHLLDGAGDNPAQGAAIDDAAAQIQADHLVLMIVEFVVFELTEHHHLETKGCRVMSLY